jgi:hypothetical protein
MTLVLTCATNDYLIQVSDRRLSYICNGRIVPVEDDQNKAVLFGNIAVFGYTGIARFPQYDKKENKTVEVNFDGWLADSIRRAGSIAGIDAYVFIRDELTKLFCKFNIPKNQKHHEVVCAAWMKSSLDNNKLEPAITLISNCHKEDQFNNLLAVADDKFNLWRSGVVKDDEIILQITGQQPTSKEAKKIIIELKRTLKKFCEKKISPKLVAGAMAISIRKIAENNSAVGKNLMISFLPKPSDSMSNFNFNGQPANIIISSLPEENAPSFFYLPENSKEKIQYGPITVFGGNILSNFEITYL